MRTQRYRTKVIEILGLPRTGKSILTEAIFYALEGSKRKVCLLNARASVCPIADKMSPMFNYWTAFSQLGEYAAACARGDEFMIADRGLLDSWIWLNMKAREGGLQRELTEFQLLVQNAFMNSETIMALFLTAEINVVLERSSERRYVQSKIVTKHTLTGYIDAYQEVRSGFPGTIPLREIDTTELSISQMLSFAAQEIEAACGLDVTKKLGDGSVRWPRTSPIQDSLSEKKAFVAS